MSASTSSSSTIPKPAYAGGPRPPREDQRFGPFWLREQLGRSSTALGTLHDFRRQHRIARGQALSIALQIAIAVEHAHRHGVIHADLEPQNVLIAGVEERRIRIVVADFSLAHIEGAVSVTGPHGTLGWSAPEQLVGLDPSTAADTYAFAMLALWLMGKASPTKVRTPELRDCLERCLRDAPGDRPSMREVRRTLEDVIDKHRSRASRPA